MLLIIDRYVLFRLTSPRSWDDLGSLTSSGVRENRCFIDTLQFRTSIFI